MIKNINAEKLIAEIKRRQEQSRKMIGGQSRVQLCRQILDFIDSLQQEQPEYGHFVSDYISGKKSIFNVGDTLAHYICTSNEEGERNIGKIENVVFDKEDGWIYTFENGDMYSEEELVSDDFYKKN